MYTSTLLSAWGFAAFSHAAASSFSPLRPPAIPLAVRSPYMNTWLQAGSDGGNGGYLAGQWPTFWKGQTTGWAGLVRVDSTVYTWMGAILQNKLYAEQISFEYTSTRSIFTFNVGSAINMTVTFMSPVIPDDLLRSSLPYSYLDVQIVSRDGNPHDVQVYTDISAEWVSGAYSTECSFHFNKTYSNVSPSTDFSARHHHSQNHATGQASPSSDLTTTTRRTGPTSAQSQSQPEATTRSNKESSIAYYRIWRQQQLEFTVLNHQAEFGYWYYATANVDGLTNQIGTASRARSQFSTQGQLTGSSAEGGVGPGEDGVEPTGSPYIAFAFAVDLGKVKTTPVSTLFQLSLHQENCVQFESGPNVTESIPCLWNSYFSTEIDAMAWFYRDYATASSLCTSLDKKVETDSLDHGGQHYLSLTSLSVRQAFGALEYTNTPDTPYVFVQEISSGGYVDTVDILFPFHPIALYMNASILRYILDPLFINQEAGNWPKQWPMHDLGVFPNATGRNNGSDESMPLEESGDMIIMALAYAQRTNDNAWLHRHYDLLNQWSNYLVQNTLIPGNQISTDDFAGALANQTNLALKGIIGIEAMAQIANRTNHVMQGKHLGSIAHNYIERWQGYAIAQESTNFSLPHTTLAYNDNDTYSLLYNLYADRELGLELVPQSVYDMQSAFYPQVFEEYGVPLDTRHTYTKTDWSIFCAAIANETTKKKFTDTIAMWTNVTPTNRAFTDLYDAINGNYPSIPIFIARPVVGGLFAFLALESAPKSGYVIPSHDKKSHG